MGRDRIMKLPQSITENEQAFRAWCELWHGEHDAASQHKGCPVYALLSSPEPVTVTELYKAVMETEGTDWKESWGYFRKRYIHPQNQKE